MYSFPMKLTLNVQGGFRTEFFQRFSHNVRNIILEGHAFDLHMRIVDILIIIRNLTSICFVRSIGVLFFVKRMQPSLS